MKQGTAGLFAAMIAFGPALAQELKMGDTIYLVQQHAHETDLEDQVCFEATAGDNTMHLRLSTEHTYILRWTNASGLAGEEYGDWAETGEWEANGSGITFEQPSTSPGMPIVARSWLRERNGSFRAATDSAAWTAFNPAACKRFVASRYELPMATLYLPEGLDVIGRRDTQTFGDEPGMGVILAGDKETDVTFFLSVTAVPVGAGPVDVRAKAVLASNFAKDPSLTGADAQDVSIGGTSGAKYDATATNKFHVVGRWIGYAVERNRCLVTAHIMGHPVNKDLMDKMVAAVESLTWKDYTCQPPSL